MELYAAMVSNLDHHVGRLMSDLEESRLPENTLIVFLSDNGAAAEDFYVSEKDPAFREYLQARYDNALENTGRLSTTTSP
jgi:arylsulfatase